MGNVQERAWNAILQQTVFITIDNFAKVLIAWFTWFTVDSEMSSEHLLTKMQTNKNRLKKTIFLCLPGYLQE